MKTPAGGSAPVIVSIQSQLVYGCAGNSAAAPLLQALGATVYAVPTVLMSNTPHYATVAGLDLPAETVAELLKTTLDRVPADSLDAILVGYIRDPGIVMVVAAFIDQVRLTNPDITVLIDPVMGDLDLGLYIPEEVSKLVCAELVPRADICTPNVFEASVMTDCVNASTATVLTNLSSVDIPIKLATGIDLETPGDTVTTRLWSDGQSWILTSPRVSIRPTGTGDLLSAAFLYYWLTTQNAADALQNSVGVVHCLMLDAASRQLGELEPWLIRSQDEIDHTQFTLESAA